MSRILIALTLVLALAGTAGADAVLDTMKAQDTELRDNWMFETNQSYNEGAHTEWNTGNNSTGEAEFRQWFWFSIASWSTATDSVVACTVKIKRTADAAQASADSVRLYRLLIHVDSVWEGNSIDIREADAMDWNWRKDLDAGTDSAWTSEGGKTAGTDYADRVLGAADILGVDEWMSVPLDPFVVDSMVNGSLPNYGFFLLANVIDGANTRVRYWSSEYTTEASRPMVIIAYNEGGAVPNALKVANVAIGVTELAPPVD